MHALLLLGTYEWAVTLLPSEFQTEGPDVTHARGGRMGIDDVRRLTREAYLTPLQGDMRVFVIAYDDMTLEAQNALLKILEEPPRTSRFYVVVGNESKLIPTLRSRLTLLRQSDERAIEEAFKEFQKGTHGERLKAIADHATKKDDIWMHEIMNGLESYAETERHVPLLQALNDLRPHFDHQGSSKKMILEHLSLMFP